MSDELPPNKPVDLDLGLPEFRTVEDFSRLIAEFQAADAGSYAFRYLIDTKVGAALRLHFRFNLFAYAEGLDPLFAVLRALTAPVAGIDRGPVRN